MADSQDQQQQQQGNTHHGVPGSKRLLKKALKNKGKQVLVRAAVFNPVTIGVLAFVFAFILILLTPLLIFGKAANDPSFAVQVGLDGVFGNTPSASDTTQNPPPLPSATCATGDYFSCLKTQFNVTVSGTTNQSQAKFFFTTLAIPLSYQHYLALFKPIGLNIIVSTSPTGINGSYALTNQGQIYIYSAFFTARDSTQKQYLIHETAHLIAYTKEGGFLQSRLYNGITLAGQDKPCYKPGGLVKTYPFDTSFNTEHEVWAESVADTIICNDKGTCGGWGSNSQVIQDFPTTCSNTFDFITSKVLGQPTTAQPIASDNPPPSSNTCSNKYSGPMNAILKDFPSVTNANFGDPLCDYTASAFKQLLMSKDPKNANFWSDIAECETGTPNGYARTSNGQNAWGKFQMGRSFPNPLKPWDPAKPERGDVPWPKQIENAVNYNNTVLNGSFTYWGTARCLCYYPKYKTQSSCNYIVSHNLVRDPKTCNNSCTAAKGK